MHQTNEGSGTSKISALQTTTGNAHTAEQNPPAIVQPETFRLPRPGQRDPFFGLPRTTYYELEKAGTIRLIRLRKRGYTRGTTLIPFDQVRAHLRGAMKASANE
jgi:hypothetical protein